MGLEVILCTVWSDDNGHKGEHLLLLFSNPRDSCSPLTIQHLVFLFVMHIYNFAALSIKA